MAGKYGVKETKEVLVAGLKIAAAIKKVAKDGVQLSDGMLLFNEYQSNPTFKAALDAALKDIALVKDEVGELDAQDGVELGVAALQGLGELILS